jgi:hypothetical protein
VDSVNETSFTIHAAGPAEADIDFNWSATAQ